MKKLVWTWNGMEAMKRLALALGFVMGLGLSGTALADMEFDQDVVPDVIFGSGNTNGGFTTDRQNGIEIGIRAKIPFVGTINSNGNGTYSYSLAETDHDSNGATARRWNFDWTVNTYFDDNSGLMLDDLTYELGMDSDPGPGTDFLTFDPVTPTGAVPFYDHSIGNNSTMNGGGFEAGDAATYLALLANNNVLQQSWRYSFFDTFAPLDMYDPEEPGLYTVYLLAKDEGIVVARSEIQVLIELPAGLPTDKGECKKGGWMTFSPLFKNQGDCVSFVNTGK